jgi:N-ethylmaleimide reductase
MFIRNYIHLIANPNIPTELYTTIRSNFSNTLILCNGLTPETAEEALNADFADLVAFGRSFIANPDLPTRIEKEIELKPLTDYPTLEDELSATSK